MYGYIYKITINNPESHFDQCYYIGQHKYNGKSYFGSGILLTEYKNKYGTNGLFKEILCECSSLEELNQKEQEYVSDLYLTDAFDEGGKCLNLVAGGGSSQQISNSTRLKHKKASTGRKMSEESKRKLSIAKKGKPCLKNRGKFRSEETKEKMRIASTGRKLSEETKEKIRQAHLGKKLSEKTKFLIGNASKVRKLSEETKEKLKKQKLGCHWYNNGIIQIFVKECPEGFVPGILFRKKYKIKPYNNGNITVYAKKCPKGFVFGELKEDNIE